MAANNIRVVCRFRPQNEREINSGGKSIISVSEDRTGINIKGEQSDHNFTFDRVFPPGTTQKDLFDECARVRRLLLPLYRSDPARHRSPR